MVFSIRQLNRYNNYGFISTYSAFVTSSLPTINDSFISVKSFKIFYKSHVEGYSLIFIRTEVELPFLVLTIKLKASNENESDSHGIRDKR